MNTYDLSGVSIMTAEPNAFMRTILRELLESLGTGRVVAAKSMADAGKLLVEDTRIDIVATELDLDGADGVELIRLIRNHRDPRIRILPVVVVTSDTRIPRVTAARDAGATEFVAKPVSAMALYQRLVQLIDRPRRFVKVDDEYFGPDRRRQIKDFMGDDRRDSDLANALISA